MGYVNEVVLVGQLGANPELDYTRAGMAVARMAVATHQKYKKGAQTITETEWHRVICFGRRAELVAEQLKKGSVLSVKGVKRTSVFKNKQGQQQQRVEVIVVDMKWPGSEKFDLTAPQMGSRSQQQVQATPAASQKDLASLAREEALSDKNIENELEDLQKQIHAQP